MLNAETYLTPQKGIGGQIRTKNEDFYVEEIPESNPSGEGPNTWLWIEKNSRTTLDVLLDIARELKINRKQMGFAGMKDKKAVTRQWICVSNKTPEELQGLGEKLHNVKIIDIIPNQKKLRMGQLVGNKFRLMVRDVEDPGTAAQEAQEILNQLKERGVPNYYGYQRFGKDRPNTHLVGKALIMGGVKEAVDRYIGHPYDTEPKHIQEARRFYDEGELEESLESMPSGMRYEKMMLRALIKEMKKRGELTEKSYILALRSIPKPLSRMLVHAYQSYLFNRAVSERTKLGIDQYVKGDILIDNEEHLIHEFSEEEIDNEIKNFQAHPSSPLYGSKVPLAGGKLGEMEQKILDEEKLKLEDFTVPQMPKLGSHGIRRAMRFKIWDVSAESTDEGVLVSFSIPKGCYATAVLREVMKVDVY
ncbi:tRNA pseudouridine(13) synthase TruD [Methanobacterium subterraneum]|uniref:Probable tRNA pseudouridine synthase D n=1 Tax=Methanobacterium subterraneum TaxID=59277 RepID=A0A2H4VAQ7_9EURY|nr:tRNA pseudouridine(13) synthase TruD [Methanobacterium subterraneum]AUB55150.1 tRNA pseudouridine(13) synthase TruD [Methanobacterium subterraneum]NMO10431.1 tRNA pseudouridine(13) synthase TruD [Methanobacterium subterraneum]